MESGQATTYEPLEGRNSTVRHEPMDSPETDVRIPKDQKHAVYMALLAAGIGFVLPYNSFIIAADYWQTRFPGKSVALDMSMTYIIVAFATVLLNNVFLTLATFRTRILFGYIVSLATLIFVAICEVAWHMFAASTAYSVNLIAVSLVAIGCTVQQSSFYGFASMLPKQYTQAVMAGESVAGFLVSSNRVVTKLLIKSDRVSTVIFFLTSTLYILFSYLLHMATIHSPFVRFHMKACAKIVLRPDENHVNESDVPTPTAKYGVLPVESSSPPTANGSNTKALSFSNPVYELSNPTAGESVIDGLNSLPEIPTPPHEPIATAPTVAYKVEHVLTPGACTPGKLRDIKLGFAARWKVAQSIYPYMVCIALAYCVTLSLYPGIESEIVSCNLGSWLPVLLMFAFNISDVIGKVLAAIPYPWSRRQLILMSGLRVVLVPLLLLCCAPRHQPVISGELAPFVFTIALGLTNGLSGSLPMMLAPAKVPGTLREVTGNMMTLSYNVGLTAGSLIGYIFESMLGPQMKNPCPTYPFLPAGEIFEQHTTPSYPTSMPTSIWNSSTTTTASSVFLTTAISSFLPTTEATGTAYTTSTPTDAVTHAATATAAAATTTMAAILSTLASTVANLPNAIGTAATTAITTVYSITDMSNESGGNTSDPQTSVELMQQI